MLPLLVLFAGTSTFAQVPVSLPDIQATPGETVTAPVEVGDVSGEDIQAFDFTVTYDPSLVEVTANPSGLSASDDADFRVNNPSEGELSVAVTSDADASLDGSGSLAELEVTAASDVAGTTDLTFASFQFNEGTPSAALSAGSVSVQDVFVSLPDIAAQSGEEVEIDIETTDLTETGPRSYQFDLSYDPSVLSNVEVVQEGTLSEDIDLQSTVDQDGGTVSVAASAGTESLEGSGTLLTIRGTLSSGSAPLEFSSFQFEEGRISAETQPGLLSVADIIVSFPEVSARIGSSQLIDVQATDLTVGTDVESYQFTFGFDPEVLDVTGIETEGTLSEGVNDTEIQVNGNTATVAVASSSPLEGSGSLIQIQTETVAVGESPLEFRSFQFNEGDPTAATEDGRVTVGDNQPPEFTDVPEDDTVAVGEELTATVDANDPDGDEVSFSLTGAPEGAEIDSESGDFSWTPAESQADSTYDIGVQASDGTASSETSFAVTVEEQEEENNPPQFTSVPEDDTVAVGEELAATVDANDPDGDEVSFSLTEAPEGAEIDSESGDFSWTPAESQADSTYDIGVQASDGSASSEASFTVTVEALPIDFDVTRDFGDASVQANYELVALPGDIDADLVETAESGFSGEQGPDWRAFRELGATNGGDAELEAYDGSDAFNFREGRAFWVISKNQLSYQGTVSPTSASSIALQGGWNGISNPLRSDLDWQAVQDANGLDEALFRWSGGWEQVDTLRSAQTGEGYYVFNSADLDSLSLSEEASGDALASGEGNFRTVNLAVRDEGDKGSSITAGIGSETSTHRAPPTHFSSPKTTLRVLGSDSGNRYVRMVRSVDGESTTFSLMLRGEESERATLEASGLSAEGPEGAVLVEEETGQSYDLQETSTVTIEMGDDGEARLSLHVGSSEVNDIVAPDETELRGNYPNPFSQQTTVELALSEQADVKVRVYNVLGQKVATVADGEMDAGTHKLGWDGNSLSSGVYFVRMEAGSKTDVHKVTVVR